MVCQIIIIMLLLLYNNGWMKAFEKNLFQSMQMLHPQSVMMQLLFFHFQQFSFGVYMKQACHR